jgi:protein-disulfide isomerase
MKSFKLPFFSLLAIFISYVAISIYPVFTFFSNPDRQNFVEIKGKKYYISDLKDNSSYKKARKDFITNIGSVLQSFSMEEVLKLEAKEKNITIQELLAQSRRQPSNEEIQKIYEDFKDRLQGMSIAEARPRIIEFINSMEEQDYRKNLLQKYSVSVNTEKPDRIEVEEKGNPFLGPKNSKVTIIEFSDFECPYCQRSQSVGKSLREKYKDKIRWVFRDFPLSFHQNAMFAHIAANCANKQGKYWELFDVLFQNTGSLEKANVLKFASDLHLDMKSFEECTNDSSILSEIQSDITEGQELGVNGTPAFFINGIMIEGAQPLSAFEKIIDQELK